MPLESAADDMSRDQFRPTILDTAGHTRSCYGSDGPTCRLQKKAGQEQEAAASVPAGLVAVDCGNEAVGVVEADDQ
jgi:hypothetical protein